jgi:NAD(P)H-dependent flavin oxidoreductase YrpB (nitropropane dioxygenase family)
MRNPLHTKLCDRLGIEYPVVAFTHCKDVAVAVINAGGFAVLGEAMHTPDEIAADIKWIRDRIGGKPFGIDLVLPASVPEEKTRRGTAGDDPAVAQRDFDRSIIKQQVQRARSQAEAPNLTTGADSTRSAPRPARGDVRRARAGVRLRPRLTGLHAQAAHELGIQVWGLVGKPRQAKKQIEAGTDVIIAQGYDAAGHTGNIGTFSIVPQVVDAARAAGVPVLAAGGVTTGRHLAAALALGADGVWTGSLWLASRESDVNLPLKER